MIHNLLHIQTEERLFWTADVKVLEYKTRQNERDTIRAPNKNFCSRWVTAIMSVCVRCQEVVFLSGCRIRTCFIIIIIIMQQRRPSASNPVSHRCLKTAGKSKYNLCTYVCCTFSSLQSVCFSVEPAGFFSDLCWVVINNPFDVICAEETHAQHNSWQRRSCLFQPHLFLMMLTFFFSSGVRKKQKNPNQIRTGGRGGCSAVFALQVTAVAYLKCKHIDADTHIYCIYPEHRGHTQARHSQILNILTSC